MASIEIVLNPNPINIDVVQLPQTNIDIVYTTGSGSLVNSVNGQTGNVLINAVPGGGTTGQVLAKSSNDDNDTEWINQQSSHPFLSLLGTYKIDTSDTTPPAGSGDIKYSNATQINSTNLYVSAITDGGMDVEVLISLLNVGTVLLIQDENDAVNYQKWQISSVPTFQVVSDSYTIPVILLSSAGTGTSNFANNHEVFFSAFLSAANPVWGGITGTLSSQTDLQSALDSKQNSLGFTPEDVSNKDIDGTLAANSDTKYPSQKAVKTYADTKRGLTPRVTSTTTATTLTPNVDSYDEFVLTEQASGLTIANPTGTPSSQQFIRVSVTATASVSITLGDIFRLRYGDTLPTLSSGQTAYFDFIYNISKDKWDCLNIKSYYVNPPVYVPIGNLISNDFNSGNWLTNGSPAATYASDGITFGSVGVSLSNYIYYNTYTDTDKAYFNFTFTALSATPYLIFGLGSRGTLVANGRFTSIELAPSGAVVAYNTTATLGNGISIGSPTKSIFNIGAISVNDVVSFSVSVDGEDMTITCSKNGTPSTYTFNTQNFTYGYINVPLQNICTAMFMNVNANIKITQWAIGSNNNKNIERLAIGDSITRGNYAGSAANRWAILAGMEINAGGGDSTQDVLNKISEIILINPQKVFLLIGLNDKNNSVPDGTWQANYQTIVSTLENAGITVVKLLYAGFGSTGIAVNNFIKATYPTSYIDTATPLETSAGVINPTYNSGDEHPNAAGNALIASTITGSILY